MKWEASAGAKEFMQGTWDRSINDRPEAGDEARAPSMIQTTAGDLTTTRIETERLILRVLGPDEADRVADYQIRNREHFRPWSPKKDEDFFTRSVQREKLEAEAERAEEGTFLRLWILDREDEEGGIVGDISFSNILRGIFLSCFLGYNLGVDHIGKGYMTEALSAAITYAFGPMGLHRLEANIMLANMASIRLAERLGFECEGTSRRLLKIDGVWEDHLRYVLLNPSVE
jgi:ribosomal-protein-alanine N-acetyltransferase